MHEHQITNEVVHRIVHACEDKGIKNPKKIVLSLGLLSGYKKESLLFYFEGIKKEIPILKNAILKINEVDGKIMCNDCKKESIVEPSPIYQCPFCESVDVKILEGNDIFIQEIT